MASLKISGVVFFYGIEPQRRCFEHASREGNIVFLKIINALGHCYGSLKTREALVLFIQKEPTVQELLKGRVNFFADIDSKSPIDQKAFTIEFAKRITLYEEFDETKMRWTDSTREGKFSKHLVYSGKKVWPTAKSQKTFWTNMDVDQSVYSKNRCMRAINCYDPKKGKFPFIKESNHPDIEFLIQVTDNRELYFEEESCKWDDLIGLLSDKRADVRMECLGVIWALRKCSEEYNIDLKDIAHKFAARSSKYDSRWVTRSYNRCNLSRAPGLGSLLYWAKLDSGVRGIAAGLKFRKEIPLRENEQKYVNDLFGSKFEWCAYEEGADTIKITPRGAKFGQLMITFKGKIQQFIKGVEMDPEKWVILFYLKNCLGLFDQEIIDKMLKCSGDAHQMAKIIVNVLRGDGYGIRVCKKQWYICDPMDYIWKTCYKTAMVKILCYVFDQYIAGMAFYCAHVLCHTDPEGSDARLKKTKQWNSTISTWNRCISTVKYIGSYCTDDKFVDKITQHEKRNWFLFAFNDKKVDIRTGIPSPIHRDDYISQTCGHDYPREMVDTTEITEIIRKIQPEKPTRGFMMKILSTGLGAQTLPKIVIFSGGGANGKTTINKLMRGALGDYYYLLGASACLGSGKNGPNVAIAHMHLKRYCCSAECESHNKSLNCSFLKAVTGDSETNARKLFSNSCKVSICPTLVLETNNKPDLPFYNGTVDHGVVRRICEIDFRSRFGKHDDPLRNLYLVDKDLNTKITKLAIPFLWLLFEAYREYEKVGLKMPKRLEKINHEYIAENDEMLIAFEENFKLQKKANPIPLREVWKRLKGTFWFSKLGGRQQRKFAFKRFPGKLEMHHYFEKYLKRKNDEYFLTGHTEKPYEEHSFYMD